MPEHSCLQSECRRQHHSCGRTIPSGSQDYHNSHHCHWRHTWLGDQHSSQGLIRCCLEGHQRLPELRRCLIHRRPHPDRRSGNCWGNENHSMHTSGFQCWRQHRYLQSSGHSWRRLRTGHSSGWHKRNAGLFRQAPGRTMLSKRDASFRYRTPIRVELKRGGRRSRHFREFPAALRRLTHENRMPARAGAGRHSRILSVSPVSYANARRVARSLGGCPLGERVA